MGREELTPSESEWQVMEVLWESREALTSSEVIEHIRPKGSMNPKMVRVLMNRLCQKGITRRSRTGRGGGELRRENAGMSSESKVRILTAEYPRFPG